MYGRESIEIGVGVLKYYFKNIVEVFRNQYNNKFLCIC